MDRDKRWERIETRVRRHGAGQRRQGDGSGRSRIRRSYEKGVTDEFIEPVTIVDAATSRSGLIRDEDAGDLLQLPRRPRRAK